MTSRPPRHNSDETPTPRVTGSYERAKGLREECLRLAKTLEAAAAEETCTPGRPDLAMRHTALRLRDAALRLLCWHDPPAGIDQRTSDADRGGDFNDVVTWSAEAHALLEARGETVVER